MERLSIMERLRTDTLADHKSAESHRLQHALALGALPREHFGRHLAQLRHVHRAIDAELTRVAATTPAVAAVVRPEHLQAPYLEEDLTFFDVDRLADPPLPATAALVDRIHRTAVEDPLAILGLHYVLEGSNNGSKFLSRVVQRAYQWQPGPGTRYMDPYGDRQREVWAHFKADMNALVLSDEECDRIVSAAREMFRAIEAMGDDLLARYPLAEAVSDSTR